MQSGVTKKRRELLQPSRLSQIYSFPKDVCKKKKKMFLSEKKEKKRTNKTDTPFFPPK